MPVSWFFLPLLFSLLSTLLRSSWCWTRCTRVPCSWQLMLSANSLHATNRNSIDSGSFLVGLGNGKMMRTLEKTTQKKSRRFIVWTDSNWAKATEAHCFTQINTTGLWKDPLIFHFVLLVTLHFNQQFEVSMARRLYCWFTLPNKFTIF